MPEEVRQALAVLAAYAQPSTDAAPARAAACPTIVEYAATVAAASRPGCARTYGTYWRKLVTAMGPRRLDEVRPSDLAALARLAKSTAVVRRNHGSGIGAEENCVGAFRAFFALAVADGWLRENPALAVRKPKRHASDRHGLTDAQLRALYAVTAGGGNDPHLDLLLVRFHLETGARRGGALALRLRDLDMLNQRLLLREKGETRRWQPVSRTLLLALQAHAEVRGASAPEDSVLRFLPTAGRTVGAPLTRRRYNTLADRWQRDLTDPALRGVSVHWLRHTAITNIERLAGFAVARAFAGHEVGREVTTSYIKASVPEVAAAVARLTGEPHPLAPPLTTPEQE